MNKPLINPERSDREIRHAALSRKAAAEGFVLLRNDGVLPFLPKKVAIYGSGARFTVKGGIGSGEVNNRRNVSIEEGLKSAGYEITTGKWLDDCEQRVNAAQEERKRNIQKAARHVRSLKWTELYDVFSRFPITVPDGRPVTEADVAASDTDTAIYVLARQAGEGSDRRREKGGYALTDDETATLRFLRSRYEKLILIINAGSSVDLGILDEVPCNAVVFFAQGGQEGGHALADVLSGKVNFSGKLSASWAKSLDDLPITKTFSYLNGKLDTEEYTDGVFVGYRYYESFGVKPRYPFGFGLSYTSFAIVPQVKLEGQTVSVIANVTNTGSVPGREVVQVYVSCPSGKLPREYQSLAAFIKTEEIKPGDSQTFTAVFQMSDLAGYETETSSYILEPGDYIVRVGNCSEHTEPAAIIRLEKESITEVCTPICGGRGRVKELMPTFVRREESGVPVLTLAPEAVETVTHDDALPPLGDKAAEEFAAKLTEDDLAELLTGDPRQLAGKLLDTAGACGQISKTVAEKYGFPSLVMADGPAGLRILKTYLVSRRGKAHGSYILTDMCTAKLFYRIADRIMAAERRGDTRRFQFCTAWPVGILQAQTFNPALLTEIGQAVAEEMKEFGVSIWLAPGMNIMRHPLCGRNFEYYSEDPVLAGSMAAALTNGVQKDGSCTVTLKHFCCNNQEENRMKVSSEVGERALREIYLKAFNMAVKSAHPRCVMTSYNRVNGVYTNNSYDLCTKVLRGEWGFDGFVMTDWDSVAPDQADAAGAIRAGNDIIMPGSKLIRREILAAFRSGTLPIETARLSAARIIRICRELGR